jgi:phage baseplate assembly protein W
MPDVSHQYGSDLAVGPTGDIAVASGSALGQQRVLRRLLTNPGDYIWHTDYGAGLAGFVGQPARAAQIRAVIRSQIFREPVVSATPEPVVDVAFDGTGTLFVDIRYTDAATNETQILTFSVGG